VIRVLIADDQALIRESLEMMLNLRHDMKVVGVARHGMEALEMVGTCKPDVVLLDLRMPVMDGLTCLERIRVQFPGVAVIMLSTFDDEESIFASLRNGSRGYLLKTISSEELADAIRKVHLGGALMNAEVAAKVVDRLARPASIEVEAAPLSETTPAGAPDSSSLNRSESKIVGLIRMGCSNKEIASELALGEGTVRNYISRILIKLGLRDRTQVALWAVNQNAIKSQRLDGDE